MFSLRQKHDRPNGLSVFEIGMRLRARYGFRELGLESLTTHVVIANQGSRRGLERAGYRQCGVRRHYYFIDGRWHDVWMGEVLRDEWEATQETTR